MNPPDLYLATIPHPSLEVSLCPGTDWLLHNGKATPGPDAGPEVNKPSVRNTNCICIDQPHGNSQTIVFVVFLAFKVWIAEKDFLHSVKNLDWDPFYVDDSFASQPPCCSGKTITATWCAGGTTFPRLYALIECVWLFYWVPVIIVFLLVPTSFSVFVNAIAVSNWSHYKLFAIEIMNFAIVQLYFRLASIAFIPVMLFCFIHYGLVCSTQGLICSWCTKLITLGDSASLA